MCWSLAANSAEKITCMVVDTMTKENGQHIHFVFVGQEFLLCVSSVLWVRLAVTGRHDGAFQESRKPPGILLAF